MFRLLFKQFHGDQQDDDDEAMFRFDILINEIDAANVNLNLRHEIIDESKGVDVHDHTVQESLVKSFKKLKEKITPSVLTTPVTTVTTDIKKAIFEYAKKDVDIAERAYTTLRTMIKYNGRLEAIQTNELTVLTIVWTRINDPINSNVRQDLIDSLIMQLSDASLNLDLSRCLSGRIVRIIQSLEAIDSENIVNIASTEDIRRELSDKIPLLMSKNTHLETDGLRSMIDNELRKDYIDTHLLTETEYIKITKDYFDAIE
jgi:hypothetical protein